MSKQKVETIFEKSTSGKVAFSLPESDCPILLIEDSIDSSLLEGKQVQLPNPGVRRKYFSMKPMSIEQARQQLDLIDHDFYLFRDQETKELQVIYKRNHGGYGVIQSRD